MTQTDGLLFDPNTYDPQQFDDETRRLLRATIDWFEGQGKKRILDDRIGEFPVVTALYPLGLRQGTSASVRLTGFNLGADPVVHVTAPADAAKRSQAVLLPGKPLIAPSLAVGAHATELPWAAAVRANARTSFCAR